MKKYLQPVLISASLVILLSAAGCKSSTSVPAQTTVASVSSLESSTEASVEASAGEEAEVYWKERAQDLPDSASMEKLVRILTMDDEMEFRGIKLQTDQRPFTVTIEYNTNSDNRNIYMMEDYQGPIFKPAMILFALVENLDCVSYHIYDEAYTPLVVSYTAGQAKDVFGGGYFSESETIEGFSALLNKLDTRLADKKIPPTAPDDYPTKAYAREEETEEAEQIQEVLEEEERKRPDHILASYEFSVNGIILKLPMTLQELFDLGFTTTDELDGMCQPGNVPKMISVYLGDYRLFANIINIEAQEMEYKDASVINIASMGDDPDSVGNPEVILPGGIVLWKSDADAVRAAYGEPDEESDENLFKYRYSYTVEDNRNTETDCFYWFNFSKNDNKLVEFTINVENPQK